MLRRFRCNYRGCLIVFNVLKAAWLRHFPCCAYIDGAVAPVGPAGPVGPVGPVAPVSLAEPAGPVAPVGPWGPVAPVAPRGPAMPAGPGSPAGPVAPVAPVGPVAPAGPVGPVGPIRQHREQRQLPPQEFWLFAAIAIPTFYKMVYPSICAMAAGGSWPGNAAGMPAKACCWRQRARALALQQAGHRKIARTKKQPPKGGCFWRRERDSNPRYPYEVYTISSRAP